ncbi:MAG: hypothetical protein LBT91_02655 [Bifidobacteriaceae bacterium]|jgi:hypothetical protein|nr:hypothetical protein [Bifidobacteriaceae bacterium]
MNDFKISLRTIKNTVNDKQIKASLKRGETVYAVAYGWGRSLSTAQDEAVLSLKTLMGALLPYIMTPSDRLGSPVERAAYKKSKANFADIDKDKIKRQVALISISGEEYQLEKIENMRYKLAFDKLWVFQYKLYKKNWAYCKELNVKNSSIGLFDINKGCQGDVINLPLFEYCRQQNVDRGLIPDVE